jgi:hypothetical protein
MNQQLLNLTRQNTASLYSLSALIHARGYWTAERDINHDTARTIFELFQLFAWSDRSLHDNECYLMEAVLEVNKSHGGHIEKLIASPPEQPGPKIRIPGCLAAAALHDSVHGTRLVNLVLNHLENLALLILMADATIKVPEMEAYRAYFAELRRSFSAEPMLAE